MSRKDQILAMLRDEPDDVFLRYSLAMELRSEGDHTASLQQLGELTSETPPHVPAFFMAAQQLLEIGQVDGAREKLRQGIEQARIQGDTHAAAEMSELLASVGQLGEDDEL